MKSALLSLLLSTSLGLATSVRADDIDPKNLEAAKPTSPAVRFTDVKAWKPLGHRWAGALNDKGEMIAIYDLAYPDFLSKFPFSVIGGRSIKKTEIVQTIWDAKFNPEIDKKVADKAIADLRTLSSGPIDDGAFPTNWWKSIPWKNMKRAATNDEPATFRLSDINLRSTIKSKDLKKFDEAIKGIEEALNTAEGTGAGDHFLERFEFTRVASGTFQVQYLNLGNARAVSQPRKIADLSSTKVEFYNSMKLELAKQVIDYATGLITVPVLNAIVDTAVSRFFHFHKLVMSGHQNMVLELIRTMEENGSPLMASMTESEKLKAIEALSFAQTSLLMSWKWIWKKPVDEWRKAVQKDETEAKAGMEWLSKHNMQVAQLNNRFAFSMDPATQVKKLLLMAKDAPNSKTGPVVAIDYSRPNTPYQYRVFIEAMSAAVNFGTKFITIPLVGSAIKKAYTYVVERPLDNAKIWESRLAVHLEARTGEDHSATLATLDHQRVNPLFQSREKMTALIMARKQMLGLPLN